MYEYDNLLKYMFTIKEFEKLRLLNYEYNVKTPIRVEISVK